MVRFFYVKYTEMLCLFSGSRGPHGPDLPSPGLGENSSFQYTTPFYHSIHLFEVNCSERVLSNDMSRNSWSYQR